MGEYDQILEKLKSEYNDTYERYNEALERKEEIIEEKKKTSIEIDDLDYKAMILDNPKSYGKSIAKKHHFGRKLFSFIGISIVSILAFFLLAVMLSQPSMMLKVIGLLGVGASTYLIVNEAITLAKTYKKMCKDYSKAKKVLEEENLSDVLHNLHKKQDLMQSLDKQEELMNFLIASLPDRLEEYSQSYNTIALRIAKEPTMITYKRDENTSLIQDMRRKRELKK